MAGSQASRRVLRRASELPRVFPAGGCCGQPQHAAHVGVSADLAERPDAPDDLVESLRGADVGEVQLAAGQLPRRREVAGAAAFGAPGEDEGVAREPVGARAPSNAWIRLRLGCARVLESSTLER